MIFQIPPEQRQAPLTEVEVGPVRGAPDLAGYQISRVELRGFEPLTPSMRTRCATGLRYSPKTGCQRSKYRDYFAPAYSVADPPRRANLT